MNERIKELKKQAEEYAALYGLTNKIYGQALIDVLDEKFAELIIRECADICQQVTNNGMFDGNQQYASAYCRDEIKRYFGVKE